MGWDLHRNVNQVVRNLPRSLNPWPFSGTITRDITATRTKTGEEDVTRMVQTKITFNNTQFVTLEVTEGGVTETYEIDLAERNVKKRFRRKNG